VGTPEGSPTLIPTPSPLPVGPKPSPQLMTGTPGPTPTCNKPTLSDAKTAEIANLELAIVKATTELAAKKGKTKKNSELQLRRMTERLELLKKP
jgi:hypothetical protein